jgi:hypothetical protein
MICLLRIGQTCLRFAGRPPCTAARRRKHPRAPITSHRPGAGLTAFIVPVKSPAAECTTGRPPCSNELPKNFPNGRPIGMKLIWSLAALAAISSTGCQHSHNAWGRGPSSMPSAGGAPTALASGTKTPGPPSPASPGSANDLASRPSPITQAAAPGQTGGMIQPAGGIPPSPMPPSGSFTNPSAAPSSGIPPVAPSNPQALQMPGPATPAPSNFYAAPPGGTASPPPPPRYP